MQNKLWPGILSLVVGVSMGGCGGNTPPAPSPGPPAASVAAPDVVIPTPPKLETIPPTPETKPVAVEEPPIPTISLSGTASAPQPAPTNTGSPAKTITATNAASTQEQRRRVVTAMDAIQVVLGNWRGTTSKEVGDFKAVEAPSWVWDFRSERGQPSLVMTSEKSQYVTEARLTYLTDRDIYRMIAKDKEGQTRTLEGTFSAPVEEFEGDDRRVHRRFKLLLTEIGDAKDALQLTLNQQDNNRYLFEIERKRGNRFMRVDTVGTQRDGSSFALNDTDYKDRTCVVSGGLGTSQVNYNGKSYWVCCSGCQAAFNEEPARWIAEFEAKLKEKTPSPPGS